MITTTEESNARKEKGETLQMDVAAKLRAAFPQYAAHIVSTPMSAHGAAWHIADIDKAIDGLGLDTDSYDRDALRAVAHLGGKSRM